MVGTLERFAAIGALPNDTEDDRIRKGALVLASGIISALSPVWVITYLLLDLPLSSAIPFAYILISVTSLIAFACTKRYRLFRTLQLALMLALPIALQWSLGGFVPSSGVALWALTCPLRALTFAGTRQAAPWFVACLALIGVSLALEPLLTSADARRAYRSRSSRRTSPACRSRRTSSCSTSCAQASANTSAANGSS